MHFKRKSARGSAISKSLSSGVRVTVCSTKEFKKHDRSGLYHTVGVRRPRYYYRLFVSPNYYYYYYSQFRCIAAGLNLVRVRTQFSRLKSAVVGNLTSTHTIVLLFRPRKQYSGGWNTIFKFLLYFYFARSRVRIVQHRREQNFLQLESIPSH